jgi:Transglycosylase SLT domain
MVLSNDSERFSGFEKILGRIKSIDQRIDSITSTDTPPHEGVVKGEIIPSFGQVFNKIRRNLSPRANRWIVEDALQKASMATGVDIDLLRAVMQQESGGNSNAVSSAGAKGLMQLIDSTAVEMGVNDSFDPHQNALGGAKYLKQQLNNFGGNLKLALAAYNAGPQAVMKYRGIPPYTETTNYVSSIEAIYRKLKGHYNITTNTLDRSNFRSAPDSLFSN